MLKLYNKSLFPVFRRNIFAFISEKEEFPPGGVVHPYRDDRAMRLLLLNNKFNLLAPKQAVLDLGYGTGSWSQFIHDVLRPDLYKESLLIGCEIEKAVGFKGVNLLSQCDFCEKETQNKIKNILDGRKLDVIVSDIEPNRILSAYEYHEYIMKVAFKILDFSKEVLNEDGAVLFRSNNGQFRPAMVKESKSTFKQFVNTTANVKDELRYLRSYSVMKNMLNDEEKAQLKPNRGFVKKTLGTTPAIAGPNTSPTTDETNFYVGYGNMNKTDFEIRHTASKMKYNQFKFDSSPNQQNDIISEQQFNKMFEDPSTISQTANKK